MYKISEFSKITNLTVKTLRYYDKEGILVPSFRDPQNGYRYYTEEDYERAEWVLFLKEMEFSIMEMKDVLENCESRQDFTYFLEEKKRAVEARIRKDRALLKKYAVYSEEPGKQEGKMNYEMQIKNLEPLLAATMRYRGDYGSCGKYYGQIAKAAKSKIAGTPFNMYYDEDYSPEAEIEVCYPVSSEVSGTGIVTKRLPGVKVLTTVHHGSYSKIGQAYKALLDYAAEHGYKCLIPSREYYIKGPGMVFRGNEDKYVTEIAVPIE